LKIKSVLCVAVKNMRTRVILSWDPLPKMFEDGAESGKWSDNGFISEIRRIIGYKIYVKRPTGENNV